MAKISNPYFFFFFIVLSICIIISLSLQKQQHLSSSIDQLKSRVSLLESSIEKWDHECESKEEVIESNFEKSDHELESKEDDTVEILESINEESDQELVGKEEDTVEILGSTIKKSDHELGSMEKDIAGIKKILEQINASLLEIESLIEKKGHGCGSKEEFIAETFESNIEKSKHELGSKEEEDTIEILESIIEESDHALVRKEEDTVEILESTIKKSDHELGIMEKDMAVIKKILEQINASKQKKDDTNEVVISTLDIKLLNFKSKLGNHLVFLASKIREACLLTINTLVTIVDELQLFATRFIKESYKCITPYIIGIVKGLLKVLACLANLAIIVIKICMQLFIGLVKALVSLVSLVMKTIVWLFIGTVKGLIQLCLKAAR